MTEIDEFFFKELGVDDFDLNTFSFDDVGNLEGFGHSTVNNIANECKEVEGLVAKCVVNDHEEVWYFSDHNNAEPNDDEDSLTAEESSSSRSSSDEAETSSLTNSLQCSLGKKPFCEYTEERNFTSYPIMKKRRLVGEENDDDSAYTSISDQSPHPLFVKSESEESMEPSSDENDEIAASIISALCPNPYAEVRRMRRRLLRIPVLPKSDLRRYYLKMFNNVINSHSPDMLKRFLQTYCNPSLTLKRSCYQDDEANQKSLASCFPLPANTTASNTNNNSQTSDTTSFNTSIYRHKSKRDFLHKTFQLMQMQEVFAFWAVKYDLHPDHTCEFENMQVITSRTTESVRIEGDFRVVKTDVYEITPLIMHSLFLDKVRAHMDPAYDSKNILQFCPIHTYPPSVADTIVPQSIHGLPLAKDPQQCTLEGKIVLEIGTDKRIECIRLTPSKVEWTPVKKLGPL